MSAALAYLMLDGPGEPHRHLMVCAFTPAASLIVSWLFFRLKIPAWISVAAALAASALVLSLIAHPITRHAMIEDFGIAYVIAIITSAAVPLLAIVHFILLRKKEAIQAAETTRGK